MSTKYTFDKFRASVQTSKLDDNFKDAPGVAIITGPAVVIEAIVREAEHKSNIPMDWGYIGGRGVVYSHGDKEKVRSALYSAMPKGDLTMRDI